MNSNSVLETKLEAEDFANLTKDDILGDLLYTTALSYYAELDTMNYVQAKTMGVVNIRLPSESIFSFELNTTYFFGLPKSVSAGGLAMDVDRDLSIVKPLDGDNDKKVQFMLASGQNSSALEHSVPEQMFSTPDEPAYGISAVKALKIANDQGIPIYTINQSNIDSILPQLQVDSGTITDIQNAVNAGKEVTVSKTDITYNGWTGCGYIIIDPDTGAGAYMISGGLSGAYFLFAVAVFFFVVAIAATGLTGGAAVIASIWFIIHGFVAVYGGLILLVGKDKADEFFRCLFPVTTAEIGIDKASDLIKDFKKFIKLFKILGGAISSFLTGYSLGECIKQLDQ